MPAAAVAAALLAAAALAAPAAAGGWDQRTRVTVQFGTGPYGDAWRWNGHGGWGDPRLHWRRYGWEEYCPQRGWRRGGAWYGDPWAWGSGDWRGHDRRDWRERHWRDADRRWRHGGGYAACVREVRRDWWQGRPAFVSVQVCPDGWGGWVEDPGQRRFAGWAGW